MTVRLGGVPIMVHMPPAEERIAMGISSLARLQPWESAMPMQTGSSTATVPVLDKKADMTAVNSITPRHSLRSEPAKRRTTEAPRRCASPV